MNNSKKPGDPVEEEGREELEYQLWKFRKEIEEADRRDDESTGLHRQPCAQQGVQRVQPRCAGLVPGEQRGEHPPQAL